MEPPKNLRPTLAKLLKFFIMMDIQILRILNRKVKEKFT